jgi:hypothetical protein
MMFYSVFFRNFGIRRSSWTSQAKRVSNPYHSEMKRKVHVPFAFLSFFRNFAVYDGEVTTLGIKNKHIYFVLLSFFRNFAESVAVFDCFPSNENQNTN